MIVNYIKPYRKLFSLAGLLFRHYEPLFASASK